MTFRSVRNPPGLLQAATPADAAWGCCGAIEHRLNRHLSRPVPPRVSARALVSAGSSGSGPVERTSSADTAPKQLLPRQSTGEKAALNRPCSPARQSAQSPRSKQGQCLRPVSSAGALKRKAATGAATGAASWRTGQTGQGSAPTLPDRTRTRRNGHRESSPASRLNGQAFPERPAFLSREMAAMQPS